MDYLKQAGLYLGDVIFTRTCDRVIFFLFEKISELRENDSMIPRSPRVQRANSPELKRTKNARNREEISTEAICYSSRD